MAARGKAAEAERTIVIPEMRLVRTVVTVVGKTPLLTNRFSDRSRKSIEDKQQHEAKGPREARDPEAEFRDALHVIAPGVYGFPSTGIKKALVAAGGRFAGEKMTHLRGILDIPTTHVPIQAPEPVMRSDPVKLKGSGVYTIAYRPEFHPWSMDVPLYYNASIIAEAQVLNLFQVAGFSVGLGAWRPESGGTFGQFTLAEAALDAAA